MAVSISAIVLMGKSLASRRRHRQLVLPTTLVLPTGEFGPARVVVIVFKAYEEEQPRIVAAPVETVTEME